MRALFLLIFVISGSCLCAGEQISFTVSLIPIVNAKSALTVKYHAGTVTIRHRDGTRLEKRVDAATSEVIEKAIVNAPTDQWKGFWQTLSIDGDIVTSVIERGGKTFRFDGLNGCPPGFASILSALKEADGRRLFTADWKKQEAESEFLEISPFAQSADNETTPASKKTGESGPR